MTELEPSTVTDPTDSDDGCPGCGALDGVQPQPAPPTVEAWSCTACGMNWATTVVNPTLRAASSVVGLLPTPQQRTADLLAVLRTEVTQHAQAREPAAQFVLLAVATWLSVFKPGGRIRR